MSHPDPRTWPAAMLAERNLALAYALGWRTDTLARAAFDAWRRRHPEPRALAWARHG